MSFSSFASRTGERANTSKQYPNSNWSFSPGCSNNPPAAPRRRRDPRNPVKEAAAPPGPNNRPTEKYAIVEINNDEPIKCTNIKKNDRRRIAPNDGVYARPQASAVRSRKNDRRCVNDGSGLCHVFFVSACVSLQSGHGSLGHTRFYRWLASLPVHSSPGHSHGSRST